MNNNDVKRSVSVGVFVFIGLVIGLIFVYLLANKDRNMGGEVDLITVWEDVGGLKKGNNIWFSGVKIGNVKRVSFRNDLKVEVKLGIDDNARQYIRKNATASLGSDGLIGNKIVVLEGGTSDADPVENGDQIRTNEKTGTDAMMATLQENNQNLQVITENLKTITGNLAGGKGLAGHLLTDNGAVAHFDRLLKNLEETAARTARAATDLNAFTGRLNSTTGLVNNLLTDTLVYANLQLASAQLTDLTTSTRRITDNLDEVTRQLKNGQGAAGKLLTDKATADQVSRIVNNLEETSEKLNENMEAMRHNFLFKGYFRKQEKEDN